MTRIAVLSPENYLFVKYKGIFDFDQLYKNTVKWFKKRSFEFHEYQLKERDPVIGETEYFWNGWRNDTEYIRVWVDVYLRMWDQSPVEVVKDGVKKKLLRARIRVNLEAWMETDYEKKFDQSQFFRTIRNFYETVIAKKKLDIYGDKVEYEVHDLAEHFKRQFNMMQTGNQFADVY